MKNFFVAFLVFLVWSVFGLWMYSLAATPSIVTNEVSENISEIKTTVIPIKEEILASEIAVVEPTPIKKNFLINSLDKEVLYESDETIVVVKDSAQVQLPKSLEDLPSKLASYLLDHPGQELHIISYYSADAKLKTPNIGEQRGINFRKLLNIEGIDEKQIVIKPVITTTAFDDDNTLKNGIDFTFRLLDRERIANYKKAIPSSITFYPTYNFDEILANKKLSQMSDSIVSISNEHPDLMINIIGHTDHIGAASENYVRGLKSSRQMRWYLINKGGIDRDKIFAISRGETEPLLRDERPASRIENARIEINFFEKE